MKPFRDLPIQLKMLVMTLVICGTILFVVITALFSFQVNNFRSNFQNDARMLAAVVANNSTAALAFKDATGASDVLKSLKAVPTVASATLLTSSGAVFARYGKSETDATLTEFPSAEAARFYHGDLLLNQPVLLDGNPVGTLCLRCHFQRTFLQLLEFYGLLILFTVALSISLAIFLSRRFQRFIAGPVLHLARTAQVIGKEKDYSVRATVNSRGDELWQLTESFNEMLGRIQSQDEAINLSQQRMQALIDSIDGVVWECDPEHFRFSFVSRQSSRILGYAPEAWLQDAGFWPDHVFADDRAAAVETRKKFAAAGKPYSFEYRLLAADGRQVWIREYGSLLAEHGKALALRGFFLDVTAQKTAADDLDRLNRRLLETSRLAGMAEVATGVLHNVGNVLNSVSVSATLVCDQLRASKVASLRRAISLMREKNGDLADFLTSDPKGRRLPELLMAVSDQISTEHTGMFEEMSLVGRNIEHIKDIVAMQQNYAKVSGVWETLPPIELVEDALRLNLGSFERHRVKVVRDFDTQAPPVCVDRHKVLQILINLMRNAKYAMDEQNADEKRLVLRVAAQASGVVAVSVSDNGVGIDPANMARIFNHGFTTRKDGHGFGLHSGANAAKELKGRLFAQSEGVGRGATFTLELPAAPPAENNHPQTSHGASV